MSTALDLIKGSLRLIGALAIGETPSAVDANDALLSLNGMIDSWSTNNLLIYAKVIETFALTPSQQTYTMGVGGNFNTPRAQMIEAATISIVGTNPPNEIPMELINLDQWASIQVKTVTSTIPMKLYRDGANPLDNLNFWPIPTVGNNVVLYSWKPLSSLATLQTTVTIPPGYYEALRYNLAVRLAPEYGRPVSQEVALTAADEKANIKRMNIRDVLLKTDAALSGHTKTFNWITGE